MSRYLYQMLIDTNVIKVKKPNDKLQFKLLLDMITQLSKLTLENTNHKLYIVLDTSVNLLPKWFSYYVFSSVFVFPSCWSVSALSCCDALRLVMGNCRTLVDVWFGVWKYFVRSFSATYCCVVDSSQQWKNSWLMLNISDTILGRDNHHRRLQL